jgi:hypothetical protein
MNENLARWVFASVANYFSTVVTGIDLPLLVEGVDEREPEEMQEDHAELRVNGPFVRELSKNYWRIWVDINILLTNMMSMSQKNAYNIAQWGGTLQEVMLEPIPIYKYGSDPGDDDSLIGCLTLRRSRGDSVRLIHFGQISREDRIRQAVVDGRYEMYLSM